MSEILYDLAVTRTVVLQDRDRLFSLHCRRITPEDWAAYFGGIYFTSEQDGRRRVNVFDATTPQLALAEAVLTGADGYSVKGGGALTSLDGWQHKIPMAHRLQLGRALADVRPSVETGDGDPFLIYPEGEVVSLDATWTAMQVFGDGDGPVGTAMRKITGLLHTLHTPSEEQHRRYARESSRSFAVGGSRTGKTVYPSSKLVLAKLYDELVVSVDGYAVDGKPLTTDRAAIVREMDTLHKVMAAQEVFQPVDTSALGTGAAEEEAA